MKKRWNALLSFIFIALLFVVFVAPASLMAQQVIELSYGTPYPPQAPMSMVPQKWMEKIEKETNGQVKFKAYWGGTLLGAGPQAVDEIASGVVDVGTFSPVNVRVGYDIVTSAQLLYVGANRDNGFEIFMHLKNKFPEIENEYKGLKVLEWAPPLEYDLISTKPFRKLSDFKGTRIKALGEVINVLKDLGAEATMIPMPDTYLAFQKGVIDGGYILPSAILSYKFTEVIDYYTFFHFCRPPVGGMAMSLKTWNKLPSDIQKVFENNIEWQTEALASVFGGADKKAVEVAKKAGVEIIELPKEELEQFYDLVRKDAVKAAKDLDAKGIPGTKIYEEIQRMVKSGGK